jgi:mRNA interferase RelE/StbE
LSYQIIIRKKAFKELEILPTKTIQSITQAIDDLSENPRPHGCKKLKGEEEYLWRIRVGNYRIIYSIDDTVKILDIRRIGHRRDIYEA